MGFLCHVRVAHVLGADATLSANASWESRKMMRQSFPGTRESMPNELVLSLRDTITFASGKTELRPRALPVLEKVVAIVMRDANLSAAISRSH